MPTDKTNEKLLCVGLGYSARPFAAAFEQRRGASVAASYRSSTSKTRIDDAGYQAFAFDDEEGLPATAFEGVTHLLVSASPLRKSEDDNGESGRALDPLLSHHFDRLTTSPTLRWVGYLSTTGVYGDHDGAWVDENAACHPGLERNQRRRAVEDAYQTLSERVDATVRVFRLAGIYGPGRNKIESVRNDEARRIIKDHAFSRIHVDDIANVLLASVEQERDAARTEEQRKAFDVFNVADDLPTPSATVVEEIARLLGKEPPPTVAFEDADLSPMAKSFYAESKRTDNAKMKRVLDVTLRYPTYKEGLAALLRGSVRARTPEV